MNQDGKAPIEVTIATYGERCSFNTGKMASPNDWSKDKHAMKGRSDDARQINDYLSELKNKVFQKEIELMKRGYSITPSLLRDAVLDKVDEVTQKTLIQVHKAYNAERKKFVGKTIAPATYYVFEHSLVLLQEYLESCCDRKDILLVEIKLGFIQGFHSFLLGDKGMCQNTSTNYLKFLKTLLNWSVANGFLLYNTLNLYKVEREPVEIDFLTEEELRKVINFDTPIARLEKARDFFLFGCFTGLSYIDIKTLLPEHFVRDAEGRIWIKKRRVKTGVLSRIPLLPMAKMILEKYKGGDKLIPIQDSSDINKYLKDIAIYCNINKNITFHTSRHTFATTVTLTNNVSLDIIAKMMGHSPIWTFCSLLHKYRSFILLTMQSC